MIDWVGSFFPSVFSNSFIREFFIFIFAVFFVDFVVHTFGWWMYKYK